MNFVLTSAGSSLLSKVIGGEKLVFTKAYTSEDISSNPSNLASISNKKQDLGIDKIIEKDGLKGLSLTLTNIGLTSEYRLRQIGVFAKTQSTEEVLFLVGQDEIGEKIPAIDSGEVEFEYEVFIKNSGTYQMTLSIGANDFIKKEMIVDSLDSDEKMMVLSAKQGKVLNDSLNSLKRENRLKVPASAWNSSEEFFVAEISASDIKASDNPIMFAITDGILKAREVKDYNKNYAYIHKGETMDGLVRLYAYKKPSIDLTIGLRGK